MIKCKTCGGLIRWVKIQGRWHCHNANGSDHWDTCSKRKWQQVVETGKRFKGKKLPQFGGIVDGYRDSVHGTKLSKQTYRAVGDVKISKDCRQCVPPWEQCAKCPNSLDVPV